MEEVFKGHKRPHKVDCMSEITGKTQAGTFHVDGKDMFGELTVDGTNSSLRLRNESEFNARSSNDSCIHGTLHDLKKVSLFDCICPGIGHAGRNRELYYFAEVFPHYVISGYQHLKPADETISMIHFVIEDWATLFYDFAAFGRVIRPQELIETIANANRPITRREVKTGPEPEIAYFAGKREILNTETALGTVSASHNPVTSMGGPTGIVIKNTISVAIKFASPVNFEAAFDGLRALRRYFELIIGRQQTLLDIGVVLGEGTSVEQYLSVDASMEIRHEGAKGEYKPHTIDLLLSPIEDPTKFGEVLSGYFARDHEWRTARVRFTSKLNQKYSYDVDRLIALANVFDVLPESCFPVADSVPDDLTQAGKKPERFLRRYRGALTAIPFSARLAASVNCR